MGKNTGNKEKEVFLTIDDARVWHCHAGNMATGRLSIALSFVCNHIPRYSQRSHQIMLMLSPLISIHLELLQDGLRFLE